jgi:hypothetical protein
MVNDKIGTKMADQVERERLDEGLQLLRTFFRIKDRQCRLAVINLVEQIATAPLNRAHLSAVEKSES